MQRGLESCGFWFLKKCVSLKVKTVYHKNVKKISTKSSEFLDTQIFRQKFEKHSCQSAKIHVKPQSLWIQFKTAYLQGTRNLRLYILRPWPCFLYYFLKYLWYDSFWTVSSFKNTVHKTSLQSGKRNSCCSVGSFL